MNHIREDDRRENNRGNGRSHTNMNRRAKNTNMRGHPDGSSDVTSQVSRHERRKESSNAGGNRTGINHTKFIETQNHLENNGFRHPMCDAASGTRQEGSRMIRTCRGLGCDSDTDTGSPQESLSRDNTTDRYMTPLQHATRRWQEESMDALQETQLAELETDFELSKTYDRTMSQRFNELNQRNQELHKLAIDAKQASTLTEQRRQRILDLRHSQQTRIASRKLTRMEREVQEARELYLAHMNPSEAVTTPVIDRNRAVHLNGSTVEGEFHQGHRRLFHDFGRDIVNKKNPHEIFTTASHVDNSQTRYITFSTAMGDEEVFSLATEDEETFATAAGEEETFSTDTKEPRGTASEDDESLAIEMKEPQATAMGEDESPATEAENNGAISSHSPVFNVGIGHWVTQDVQFGRTNRTPSRDPLLMKQATTAMASSSPLMAALLKSPSVIQYLMDSTYSNSRQSPSIRIPDPGYFSPNPNEYRPFNILEDDLEDSKSHVLEVDTGCSQDTKSYDILQDANEEEGVDDDDDDEGGEDFGEEEDTGVYVGWLQEALVCESELVELKSGLMPHKTTTTLTVGIRWIKYDTQ
eukprot:scaffold3537_cov167-Amphora_coffeaeformis.AAC.1